MKYFRNNNIPISICTAGSSGRHYIKVHHFGDFVKPGKYFAVVVLTGDDPEITHKKPHPEPYLVTFKRLPGNPKPENILVYKDLLTGMKSATAAGAQCVLVPDWRVDLGHATSEATLVIKSLNDFDTAVFSLQPFTSASQQQHDWLDAFSFIAVMVIACFGIGLFFETINFG